MTKLTGAQITRLTLYITAVITGAAAIVTGYLELDAYTQLLTGISGALLMATGGTAALNLEKGAKPSDLNLTEVLAALTEIVAAAKAIKPAPAVQPTPVPEAAPVAPAPTTETHTPKHAATEYEPLTLDWLRDVVAKS